MENYLYNIKEVGNCILSGLNNNNLNIDQRSEIIYRMKPLNQFFMVIVISDSVQSMTLYKKNN
jgi:hypothetical protein